MADYIDRKELIENLNKFAPEHYSRLIDTLIEKQPAADVVEVVRCKDCKLWENSGSQMGESWDNMQYVGRCEWTCYRRYENDYCSYGERKTNDT